MQVTVELDSEGVKVYPPEENPDPALILALLDAASTAIRQSVLQQNTSGIQRASPGDAQHLGLLDGDGDPPS